MHCWLAGVAFFDSDDRPKATDGARVASHEKPTQKTPPFHSLLFAPLTNALTFRENRRISLLQRYIEFKKKMPFPKEIPNWDDKKKDGGRFTSSPMCAFFLFDRKPSCHRIWNFHIRIPFTRHAWLPSLILVVIHQHPWAINNIVVCPTPRSHHFTSILEDLRKRLLWCSSK